MNPENPLKKDLEAFEAQREALQKETGKFVVFYKGELVGAFASIQEAYGKGYEKAGSEPFLVRQITDIPTVQHFSRAIRFKCLTSP
jgi:hypothetical protein